jgi:hypothetical protein
MGINHAFTSAKADGADATLVRASDWNAAHVGNNLGLYNVKDPAYGAHGNGSDADTAHVQAAIDACTAAGGGTVWFPAGTYQIHGLELKSNVRLLGDGISSVIQSDSSGTYTINIHGTVSTGAVLSANATEGAQSVATGVNDPGLAAGDYVLIRDTQYVSTTVGRNQELNRVLSVAGTNPYVVTLHNSLIGTYLTASTAEILKLNALANTVIENLKFLNPDGYTSAGLYYEYAYGATVRNCWFSGMHGTNILASRSAYLTVTGCDIRDGQDLATLSYGINVDESSHHGVFTNNYSENIREHGFGTRARHMVFANNVMRNHYDDGVNTHGGGCSRILIANNVVSGVQLGGGILVGQTATYAKGTDSAISVVGNYIDDTYGRGIGVTGDVGFVTNDILVVGNHVRRWGLKGDGSEPGIYLAGGGTAAYLLNVLVSDNVVSGDYTIDAGRGIACYGGTDITIQGNFVANCYNQYGIHVDGTSSRVTVRNNTLVNIASNNVRITGTNAGLLVVGNTSDDYSTAGESIGIWQANNSNGVLYDSRHQKEITFTETTGASTYTGSVTVPAGCWIEDIRIYGAAVWNTTTTATMIVGDAGDPDGWYTAINLKETDLLVGEVISFHSSGGKEGVYLVQASGLRNTMYSASARVITGVVTTVGAAGTLGRTRMLVIWSQPGTAAAVKA